MSATKNTATEIIVGLAEEHLTSKIVDAAKGKTTRLSGLAKEIRNCFNIENFLAEATSAIEQLIEKKIEDALKKVDTKKSRVSKKKVVVEAPVEAEEAPVEAEEGPVEAPVVEAPVVQVSEPQEPVVKEKKKRVYKKKVVVEAPVVEAPVEAEEAPVEAPVEQVSEPQEPAAVKEKKKRAIKKKEAPVEQVSESQEPTVVKEKKKRAIKKKEAPVETEAPVVEAPVVEVEEPKENRPSTPILPDSPEKDADAETETNEIPISDFIQPIGDELQEEELSEIEDDDDDEPIPLEVCDKNTKKKFYIDGSKKEINNKCFKDKDLKVSANVLCIYPDADSSQEPIFNYL
jgi:hypothetical protein